MALSVEVRDVQGTSTGTATLDEAMFGIEPNVAVLHQVVTAQLAAARSGTQSTKTRAEVSGGGRKPFKQKGTGRARQGSERAPQFTGGGVALGPKPRSHRQRTPRKMIQLALRSALSDRASEDRVVVVHEWPWDAPSTRDARIALDTLELFGRVLVVLDRTQEDVYKSFRNLPGVQLLLVEELNAYDILCNDWIVFTPDTLPGESSTTSEVAASRPATSGGGATETAGTDVNATGTDVDATGAPSAEADIDIDIDIATDADADAGADDSPTDAEAVTEVADDAADDFDAEESGHEEEPGNG